MKHIIKNKRLWHLLMVAIILLMPVGALAQNIKLKGKTLSLRNVIQQVEKQTSLSVSYDAKIVDVNRKVNVNDASGPAKTILPRLFSQAGYSCTIAGSHVLVTAKKTVPKAAAPKSSRPQTPAKRRTLTGTVIDASNQEPLIGVTVQVKDGGGQGTVTDIDGNFSIGVTNSTELVFSYVGYKQQTKLVGDLGVMDVQMSSDNETIDEVVVVGAGTQKKVSLTGSISTVRGSDLRAPSSSLTNNFEGKFAGIISQTSSGESGQESSFYIRGVSTFGGRATPLILLDGVEITSSELNSIPTENIESFTLLKDASATAIYGVRGANGVMLITTKQGTENTKARVNATFEATYVHTGRHVDLADGATWMETYNEALLARTPSATPRYSEEDITNTRNHINQYVYPDVDWYDTLFKNGNWNERGNISVNGGGSRVSYYMSLQVNHDSGILKSIKNYAYDNNIDRMSYVFQNNIAYKLTNTTKIDLHMNAQIRRDRTPLASRNNIFGYTLWANPVMFPATFPQPEGGADHVYFGNATLTGSTLRTNPLAYMMASNLNYNKNTLNISLNFRQDFDFITKGLNFTALVNFKNMSESSYKRSINPYYYKIKDGSWTADDMNSFELEQLGTPGTDYVNTDSSPAKNSDQTFYLDARLNYQRSFGLHNVSGMLMYMMREYRNEVLPNRNQGLSGRATYDYDNRYLFEFNFGYNGTERLAKGHRFYFFPAVSLGWVPSQEKFWEPISKAIDFLKIRASYGLVGSDETGSSAGASHFLYFDSIALGGGGSYTTGPDAGQTWTTRGPAVNGFAVQNATWEKVKKLDIGVDVELFNQLSITYDYFHDHRYDILMKRGSWPYLMGYFNAVPWSNIGVVDNWGHELSVNWKKQINKDWYVDARFNWTYTQNKYKNVDEPNYPYVWQKSTGMPLSCRYGYIAEGLFRSQEEIDNSPRQDLGSTVMVGDIKYRDVNGDGIINTEDEVMISPYGSMPRIQYGIGLNIVYKKIDFGVFFNGTAKRSLMLTGIRPFGEDANGLMQFIADDHFSVDKQNFDAKYPRLGLNDQQIANNTVASTYWLRNGRYLRWKTLEVGYSFPYCRVYFSGDNLAVWGPFKHWDPEQWYNNYPFSHSFNFGVQVNL